LLQHLAALDGGGLEQEVTGEADLEVLLDPPQRLGVPRLLILGVLALWIEVSDPRSRLLAALHALARGALLLFPARKLAWREEGHAVPGHSSRQQLDIRSDADPLDGAASLQLIAGDRQPQSRAVGKVVQHLHRAPAERRPADDDSPVLDLEYA